MSEETITLEIDNPVQKYDGEEYFDDGDALAYLFAKNSILFVSGSEFGNGPISCINVNANDVFMWACSDCISLPTDQIEVLYKMVVKDPDWGAVKWCCIQQKLQPQAPMKRDIIKAGLWDDVFEALPANKN